LNVTTGSAGGFAIPITIDPSIIMTGSGVLNPIRDLANVESIETDVWKGVSSDGVTAAFAAEATEATDASPVLVQPTLTTQKAFCFVPFSIEVGQDWSSLQSELARLMDDAKNVLEASKFLLGTGTNEPGGILNIGGTGGLTTTQRVQTATTAVTAIADVYSLRQALPARFIGNASWTFHPNVGDVFYRFVASGSTTEPQIFPAGDRSGPLLGKPHPENSVMSTATTTTAAKIALYGDFNTGYKIVDRLGGTVELIPHLFGATNRFPTGQRGLYYYWRVGGGVQGANALRYLEVK
jgi:HK97 family phage major capsid protein